MRLRAAAMLIAYNMFVRAKHVLYSTMCTTAFYILTNLLYLASNVVVVMSHGMHDRAFAGIIQKCNNA